MSIDPDTQARVRNPGHRTSMSNQNRVPKGVPTGGQFSETRAGEASFGSLLTPPSGDGKFTHKTYAEADDVDIPTSSGRDALVAEADSAVFDILHMHETEFDLWDRIHDQLDGVPHTDADVDYLEHAAYTAAEARSKYDGDSYFLADREAGSSRYQGDKFPIVRVVRNGQPVYVAHDDPVARTEVAREYQELSDVAGEILESMPPSDMDDEFRLEEDQGRLESMRDKTVPPGQVRSMWGEIDDYCYRSSMSRVFMLKQAQYGE